MNHKRSTHTSHPHGSKCNNCSNMVDFISERFQSIVKGQDTYLLLCTDSKVHTCYSFMTSDKLDELNAKHDNIGNLS